MEISILFSIFLITLSLGGVFLLAGKICLIREESIDDLLTIKFNPKNRLSRWAVKLANRMVYLLNTVILDDAQKAAQKDLIQLQNIQFEG